MSWNSGPCNPQPHLVTVTELLEAEPPLCCGPGPAWSKCGRNEIHPQPCAALGTNGYGQPVVVTWYRPTSDAWPLVDHAPRQCSDPGE